MALATQRIMNSVVEPQGCRGSLALSFYGVADPLEVKHLGSCLLHVFFCLGSVLIRLAVFRALWAQGRLLWCSTLCATVRVPVGSGWLLLMDRVPAGRGLAGGESLRVDTWCA